MKVRITFDFDIEDRKAISSISGRDRPATNEEIKHWIISTINAEIYTERDRLRWQGEEDEE